MGHTADSKDDLLARVRRIAGQVSAVERGLVRNADCAEILHLVAAVRGAVNGLLDEIVIDHLDQHVARPDLSDAERRQGADELITVIRRYVK
jgi:DNA-binding FrmR family transcriptional regulator